MAAFLRVLSALENIRSAVEFSTPARDASVSRVLVAAAETGDALDVLRGADLHPEAVRELLEAKELLDFAARVSRDGLRRTIVSHAVDALRAARRDLVED